MTTQELLSQFMKLGIKLWADGERLRYKAPRGVMTAELQARLVKHKAEIIAYLQSSAGQAGFSSLSIIAPTRPEKVPLSFAQQRLWFVDQLEPGNAAYNMFSAVRLHGVLDIRALAQAFQQVIQRHESLRTTFQSMDGQPYQLIVPALEVSLPLVDLSALAGSEQESEIARLAREAVQRPFDLAHGPLVRCTLLKLADDEHILLLAMHHIISDGWSMGVLFREIVLLGQAFAAGQPDPLPALPLQYPDFALWQRDWLQGDVLETQLNYWKKQLAGAPTALELPTDHARPAMQTFRGARLSVSLPRELSEALQALSQQEGTTLFMTLLAAFQMLLSRYSRQADIVVGSPIANRNRSELEGLIGFFVNTLVLRTDLSGNPPFHEALRRVRETCLGAYDHQDLPFEKLVDEVQAARDLSRNPLFQAMFILQNTPLDSLDLGSLRMQPLEIKPETAQFDLSLSLQETPAGLAGSIEYNTDLFEPETIARLAGHFQVLLEGIVADPEQRLSELPLLSPAEQEQILIDWNATETAYPQDKCLHELFETQAKRTPQAIAVIFEGQQLTYRELDQRANQLGHYLQEQGVGPDVLVGICVERSLEMVIGLLGILKAGGAYVPLDPNYPQERLGFMLEDSRPAVLLTQQHLQNRFPTTSVIFCLDSQWTSLDRYSHSNPPNMTLPDHLAYVIYTSGSTGKPKGSLLQHNNVTRLFSATAAWFAFSEKDVWTLFHSYAFDFSVWEIWGALLYGGKLVIVPYLVSRSPDQFHALLAQEKITILNQTPSAFQQLVQADLKQTTPQALALRKVIFGGEALNQAALGPWFNRYGYDKPNLINMYGITETTVHVTYYPLQADAKHVSGIGRPIPDLGSYLVDAHLNLVPVGVPGELCVAGDGLARGYLNRPDLTAEKFIPNPFSNVPGARMYRSGDLARWLPDGSIEYLGRIDHQVKIRGFRIELGEIEAALAALPEVREAAVLAREDIPGDKRLAAYLVTQQGKNLPETAALRSRLLQSLPDYMLPAHFIQLEQLPLTPNGKLDHKALPAPDMLRSEVGYVAPRTPTEETLAQIWAQVLKLDKVGIYDNFFELGGHSLLAITLIERMRQASLSADVRTLFATPTIAALATAVNIGGDEVQVPPNRIPDGCEAITPDMLPLAQLTADEITQIAGAVPGGMANIQDIYPLAPLQEGILFHHLMSQEGDAYILPSLVGFDSRERLESFVEALQVVIKRHDILRTAVVWNGVLEPVQVVWREAQAVIEEVSFNPEDGDIAQQLSARFDPRHTRLDVRQAPMLRGFIAEDRANGRWLLQILFHHLIGDHTTLELAIAEIQDILEGREAELPAAFPFRNFVAQAKLGIPQAEHKAFFTTMLSHVDEPTAPFGLLDVQGDGSGIEETRREVDAKLARRLRQQARNLGVSAASVMHLAWAQVLAKTTGRQEVVFGTVLFGRMQGGQAADRVMGMFINTLPVRIPVGEQGVQESVRQTHARLTQLLRHEHASLALAQRCSGVQAPAPLFSALLNYRHSTPRQTDAELAAAPGWEGMQMLGSDERTNYPLTLSVDDLGEGFTLTAQVSASVQGQRVCDYMHTALENLVQTLETAPHTPANQIEVLPVAEREQLLLAWNATAEPYPQDQALHELFEAQVKRTPTATALVFEDEQFTYQELNQRANQLAHFLQTKGVGPDVVVGICVERSLEMVVGLLGILKAGGAYVPLDPAFPKDRLAFMLADSRLPVLLTQQKLAAGLPEHAARLIYLDADWPEIAQEKSTNPKLPGCPQQLAYVIYTSGSTGRPKGVQVTQQAVVNFLAAMRREPGLTAEDRLLSVTTLSFDIAGLELYLPLIVGAQVEIVSHEIAADGFRLRERLKSSAATIMQATPATWRLLLEAGWTETEPIKVLCGGEALPQALAAALLPRASSLWNMYGPTETTVWSTLTQIESADAIAPIGRPIANTQAYVLDVYLNPVPLGVPGELYIGGDGLARGYLNRPELTAEKFVPDPFSQHPNARLYRTGDLARWLPDGNLEYLGRVDFQVKVHGFRIELGEIESVLSQNPDVRQAVVIAREDQPGDKRLVAYLVLRPEAEPSINQLRSALKSSLPDYMLPAAFVFLDQLPLTPNGKIDRKALPMPDRERRDLAAADYVAPRTPVEQILVDIWKQVLNLEQVGIHDNFFDLGGDSLLAMRVVARGHRAGLNFTPQDFFQHQTIAELAVPGTAAAAQTEPETATGLLPLTVAQRGFFSEKAQYPDYWNIPRLIEVPAGIDPDVVEQIVQYLWTYHDALRTRFIQTETGWQQLIPAPGENTVPFSYIDFSGLPAGEHTEAIERATGELQQSLSISEGPLMRVALFNLGANRPGRLFVVLHHLIYDATSGIFFEDFFTISQQVGRGESAQLPPKTASLSQWLERLDVYTRSPELHQELDYWLSLPWTEIHSLPVDYPESREKNTWESAHSVPARLSPQETEVLLREIPKAYGVQLMDVLVTALVESITSWSNQRWSMFSTVDFGRNAIPNAADLDLSRTVGWFAIDRRLVLQRGDHGRPEEILKSIRAQLQNMPNRGLGYELLSYGSQDKDVVEKLRQFPRPEMTFNYVGRQSRNTNIKEAYEYPGPACDPRNQRPYVLDCSVSVLEGRLVTNWRYSKNLHKQATIKKVAENYIQWLQTLVARHASGR